MPIATRDINGNIVHMEEKRPAVHGSVHHSGSFPGLNIPVPVKLPTRPKQPRISLHHDMPKIPVPYISPQRKVPSQHGMPKTPVAYVPPQRKLLLDVQPPNIRFEDANVRFETSK